MTTYLIREENMERLAKKLATIEKKCSKSKCSFHYEVTDTIFQDVKLEDGTTYTAKYFQVEVEGTAKYNGWRFVATLDHHDSGNVIRSFDHQLVIPKKYETCGPTCEHCNTIRSRKDTYLVYNDDTKEFKQVGKSCLQEFTHGLSAEDVALYCKYYEEMEGGFGYSGPSENRYISVENILRYAFECYRHWGYSKSESSFEEENGYLPTGYRSTRSRVTDYYYINRCLQAERDRLRAEMDEVGFDKNSEYAVNTTAAALEWIRNISKDEMDKSTYIRNLHIICSDDYTDWRSLGFLVSLTITYNRHIEKVAAYEKKQNAIEAEKRCSEYVGEVGQRVTINCKTFDCVSSWETRFGVTFLYKFTDANDNVYIWYASKCVDSDSSKAVSSITGTVKDHSEYNGLKQTVLTRCKVEYSKVNTEQEEHAPASDNVQKALDDFFEYVNS